jgi:twitching motility protein PilT
LSDGAQAMQLDKLFQILARPDVKELALQSGRPPCALVGQDYAPIVKRNFTEEDVIAVLVEADGQTEVMGLIEGQRRWDYRHPSLGTVRITAGYHGDRLQARIKLIEAAPKAAPPPPSPAAAPLPSLDLGPTLAAPPSNTVGKPRPPAFQEPGSGLHAAPPAVVPLPEAPRAAEAPPEPPPPSVQLGGSPLQVFESLLDLSRSQQASDLHILADRPPTLRLAGDLVPVGESLPAELVERMLLQQVPASVREDLDRHGACDFPLIHPRLGRFRANVTRQRTGYKLTARPIRDGVPTLEGLGLPKSIANATHHHQGLIVVTGPTGHGKTTTLAAIVDLINQEHTHHIITVEDPIEFVHPPKRSVISQRQVGSHTKTFAAALKGSLREDPDVIVVGELRDTETVRMALSASETGHLVISTMNTPSAAKAIERIIDLFPAGDQPQVRMTLAGGLRLIVSQRLVPTTDRRNLCAAAELLPGSPPLWALIRDNKTFQIPSLQQRGKALGIIRLDDSLAELVRSGKTTMEIAREFAEAPDQFEALVAQASRPADAKPATFDPQAGSLGKDLFSKAKLFGERK